MELREFTELTYHQKREIILTTNAIYLNIKRATPDVTVFLYYVDGLFVEFFYSTTTSKNTIINAFTDSTRLELYLSNIQINEVYERL